MRQEARLRQQVEIGGVTSSYRDHLLMLARMGDHRRDAELRVPPCPPQVAYLVEMAHELHGRSGASQVGLLPLSPTVLRDWARLMGEALEPYEADALLLLDAALLYPGKAAVTVEEKPKGKGRDFWKSEPVDA